MPMSPRLLRPRATGFNPRSISGLALWLDAADSASLYTTDAGPVTAVSAPTEISGCVGWYDASDTATLFAADTGSTLATTTVGRWANKGTLGAAADLLQSAAGSRPTTNANTRNGRNVMTFTAASTNWMQRSFTLAQPCTMLIVFSLTEDPTGKSLTITDGAGTGNTLRFFPTGSNNLDAVFNTGAGSPQMTLTGWGALNTWHQGAFIASGANSQSMARRGGLIATNGFGSSGSATNPNGFTLGSWGASALQHPNMQVAEVVIFNSALTVANMASVEAYLAAKWNVVSAHAPATAANDPVGAWLDKSGNGRHATQATAAGRPVIGTLGSRTAASFAGANSVTVPAYPAKATSTYIYVSRNDDTADTIFQTGFTNQYHSHLVESTTKFRRNEAGTGGVVLGSNIGVGLASLWCVDYSNAALAVRYNGALVGATTTASTNPISDSSQVTTLGRLTPTETYAPLHGRIAEFLVYGGRNLTDAEKSRLERYLASKWGITLAPQVSNAEAQDWINRVYANGGTVSATTAAAVNTFCESIQSAGLRDRFYRLNLFCGNSDASLNAVRTPLYRGQSLGGTQFGNTTDINAGNLFVPADYSEGNGLTGNGSTKYLQTGLASSAFITGGNVRSHLAVYKRTSTNSGVLLSARSSGLSNTWESGAGGNLLGGTTGSFPVPSTHDSLIGVTRTTSTDLVAFRRTSLSAVNTASASVTGTSIPFAVFARNDQSTDTNAYSPNLFSNQTLAAYSIGIGLDATQIAAYDAAMQAFQAALGRNV